MATAESTRSSATGNLPIVVDLGKQPRKQIKKLTEGRGKLLDEVDKVIQELKVAGKISGSAQPVVIVVKQKAKASVFPWMQS